MGIIIDYDSLLLITVEGIVRIGTSLVNFLSGELGTDPIGLSRIGRSINPVGAFFISHGRGLNYCSVWKSKGERVKPGFGGDILRIIGEVSIFIGEVDRTGKSI